MKSGIIFDKVSYEYPNGFRALHQIDSNIEVGQFIVIMGSNGAGKSTMCLTLNGIIPHSMGGRFFGAVSIDGMDTLDHEVYQLARHVGLVMQNPEAQLFCTSVEDELAFGPENLCVPVDQIRTRIHAVAKAIRIEDLLERSPSDLSGGQIQRVVTAAMITMEPKIMVFDEATSALDPRGASELFELALELNQKQGMTIMMTEHKSEQIAEFADYIIILKNGSVVDYGTPKEILTQVALLAELKVAPPQVTRLMDLLGYPEEELPITLDEAEKMIRSELKTTNTPVVQSKPDVSDTSDSSVAKPRETVLELKEVSFNYPGGIQALEGINLVIRKGDFLGIIGENGAGKTTLVKHLVKLFDPTEGQVKVFNEPMEKYTTSLLAGRIGLVMQNPDHQLFKPSVLEEVRVGPERFGLEEEEISKQVAEVLELVKITEMGEDHPLSLSWGDRQRVALASILVMNPEVIIFDEPTTGQDLEGRLVFMELAKDLNDLGYTIIVVTHDMELITRYTKRCVVMGEGRILMDDSTKEVFAHPEILEQTFIEVPQIVQLSQRLVDLGFPPTILTIEGMAEELRSRGVSYE